MSEQFLTVKAVCERLSCSRTTIHWLTHNDPTFPKTIKLGRKMARWRAVDVDAWMARKAGAGSLRQSREDAPQATNGAAPHPGTAGAAAGA